MFEEEMRIGINPEPTPEQVIAQERKLYQKTLKQEKKHANDVIDTFLYEGLEMGIDNIRTLLKPEDIMEADAARMNELRGKEAAGEITEEERGELGMRERGDLFLVTDYKKRDVPHRGEIGAGFVVREWKDETIKGVLDGSQIELTRGVYPEQKDNRAQKGGIIFKAYETYKGRIGERILGEDEVKKLHAQYRFFAEMRTKEIQALKEEKEIQAFGHTLHKTV